MNVSCLIFANSKPHVAGKLTAALHRLDFNIFMHVDAKANIEAFRTSVHPSTRILEKRKNLSWGGFSMVEAVIDLAYLALNEADSSNFLHLSDDTYPIRSDVEIKKTIFLGRDLIDTPIVKEDDEDFKRISQVFLPDVRIGNLRGNGGYLNNFVDKDLADQICDIKEMFETKCSRRFPYKYSKGANWWCLTRKTIEKSIEVYESMPEFTDWFRYSAHPDEAFFNSVVVNFLSKREQCCSPVGSIWDRSPRPYEFSSVEDYPIIERMPQIFARKFSDNSDDLIKLLEKRVFGEKAATHLRF